MKFVTFLALAQAIRIDDLESMDLTALSAEDSGYAGYGFDDETAAAADPTAGVEDTAATAVEADVSAENTDGSYLAELKIDDGITINVLSEGTGQQCQAGQTAQVQYTGALASNGEVFDSSIPRGEPISFAIGEMTMIKCWESAMVQMSAGEKADLGCPAATAYGASAKPGIPANSDLIFNVEVVSCE